MAESSFTGPFRFGAARRAGLTPGQLRGPGFTQLGRGLYAPVDAPGTLLERAAAELTFCPPDTLVTGVTALHLHGITVGDPLPVRAVTASGQRSRRAGVQLVRASVLPPERSRLVRPVHAWLMACCELDLLEAVTAGDWLVRTRRADRTELVAAAAKATGRGCRLARRAATLVRDRVDSPQETRLRLALVLAGLPEPECNLTLGTAEHPIGRVDLVYLAYLVLVEYDGDQHRTDKSQWNIDLDRNDAFGDTGYLTIRVSAARIRRPREVVARVHAKLVERGYVGPAPHFNAEWVALFESSGH